jgi:hypothetical protein
MFPVTRRQLTMHGLFGATHRYVECALFGILQKNMIGWRSLAQTLLRDLRFTQAKCGIGRAAGQLNHKGIMHHSRIGALEINLIGFMESML